MPCTFKGRLNGFRRYRVRIRGRRARLASRKGRGFVGGPVKIPIEAGSRGGGVIKFSHKNTGIKQVSERIVPIVAGHKGRKSVEIVAEITP